jgi:hypothetical protein
MEIYSIKLNIKISFITIIRMNIRRIVLQITKACTIQKLIKLKIIFNKTHNVKTVILFFFK